MRDLSIPQEIVEILNGRTENTSGLSTVLMFGYKTDGEKYWIGCGGFQLFDSEEHPLADFDGVLYHVMSEVREIQKFLNSVFPANQFDGKNGNGYQPEPGHHGAGTPPKKP